MIGINVSSGKPIGDALSLVPWMRHLCERHNTGAVVAGRFNALVAQALNPAAYPFQFAQECPSDVAASYTTLALNWAGRNWRCHICQCYFEDAGEPLPALPMTLNLLAGPCGVPPGLVIAPFSGLGRHAVRKVWPHDRWVATIREVMDFASLTRCYVLGTWWHDDVTPYLEAGCLPYFDHPLAEVLDLMRTSPLVLTTDNGMSHLAHYGGIDRHVLLCPSYLGDRWIGNPRGITIQSCAWAVDDIEPEQVVRAARAKLR